MLIYVLLGDDIEEIEKSDSACSATFVEVEFSQLFLHPSTFLIKDSRSA